MNKSNINTSESPSILGTHPHLKDFFIFLDEHNRESERGSVLVAASMLDDLLMKIIKAFLIVGKSANKLTDGFNAPLGTFSAKIEAAYSLGLIIDEEYNDINAIKTIRNKFAHSVVITFEDRSIIDICNKLHYSAKSTENHKMDAKGLFGTAAVGVILNLTNRAHYVSLERLKSRSWKH